MHTYKYKVYMNKTGKLYEIRPISEQQTQQQRKGTNDIVQIPPFICLFHALSQCAFHLFSLVFVDVRHSIEE